jgi:hypothetical protein
MVINNLLASFWFLDNWLIIYEAKYNKKKNLN